jgi:hypothetical protein
MFRLICSTISIAAVLGLLAVGCGGDDSTKPAVTAGTGSTATGPVKTGSGGVTGSMATGPVLTGTGGTTPVVTGAGGTPVATNPCGNGAIDGAEKCDGSNLNGETCATLGLGSEGDILTCNADCTDFTTDLCVPVTDDAGPYGASSEDSSASDV